MSKKWCALGCYSFIHWIEYLELFKQLSLCMKHGHLLLHLGLKTDDLIETPSILELGYLA